MDHPLSSFQKSGDGIEVAYAWQYGQLKAVFWNAGGVKNGVLIYLLIEQCL
jgi:hypothetical protein